MRGGVRPARRALRPTEVLARTEPIMDAIEAYRAFDQRKPGWMKVALEPEATEDEH